MPQFQRRPMAAAILLMFSASPAALAQAQSEQTLPEVKVKESPDTGFRTPSTRSGTRTETPLRDIPQFINEVPQAVIRSQGATTLSQALRNAPGISYAAAEGGTQSNQVLYLRGFPLNQDIFIDGVRDMGEYNRDLFATDSVEVLKGPSALMFGRGGSGGLINQVTKTADMLQRKEIAVTFGSFEQKRVVGDLNLRMTDDSAFRLIALKEDSGFYRYPQGVDKTGFAPSIWLNIGKKTDVTLSHYYLDEKSVTDYGQPTVLANGTFFRFAPVSAKTYYGFANNDYANYQTNITTLKVEHEFNKAVSLRNVTRWARYNRQSESTIAQGVRNTDVNGNPVTGATPDSLLVVVRNHDSNRTRDNADTALINQTDLTWKFDTGGIKHTLLTGLELSREKLNRWNYTLDADPTQAGAQAPSVTSPLLAPNPYSPLSYTKTPNLRALASGDTVAAYAQDQIELSKHWKALVGLRWERFTADATTQTILTGATAAGPFARTDNMVSGRAGLIWQPTDRQSYYISYANSYNPSGELGVYAGTAQTNLNAVNQNLSPEENRNYEVGTTLNITNGVQLRSAIFRTEKINQRINNSITGVTELAGKRRVDGIEFELTGAITPNWDVYSGVAFSNGKIVTATANQGNKPLGVADVAGNVWTVYRLGGGWEVGGGVVATSGSYLTDANNAKIPSYAVLDATVAYVQKKYEIRANFYNITDKLYYMGGYQNAANRVIPGQPFMASLTLRYNFD